MNQANGIRQRAAARDALAARTRMLTGGALTVSAILSGVFAGIAAASAPGHRLLPGVSTGQALNGRQIAASARSSTAIPPLPAAPGPGNLGAASAPAPTPAPAPSSTQSPPVAVSGGS